MCGAVAVVYFHFFTSSQMDWLLPDSACPASLALKCYHILFSETAFNLFTGYSVYTVAIIITQVSMNLVIIYTSSMSL